MKKDANTSGTDCTINKTPFLSFILLFSIVFLTRRSYLRVSLKAIFVVDSRTFFPFCIRSSYRIDNVYDHPDDIRQANIEFGFEEKDGDLGVLTGLRV